MEDRLSLFDVWLAYADCRLRKRNSRACAEFERNELINLQQLCDDLNNRTYTIGRSDTFCVTRPKVREVFAADFRDRIVHHLLIQKLLPILEEEFIEDTYNCREKKGTDYGVNRLHEYLQQYPNGWILKCDLKGFFMSINRELLADMLEKFIREKYLKDDTEEVVWLTRMIVTHAPEKNCIRKGDLSLWKKLSDNKSLFTNGEGLGLAIGNLTSQVFANFYLSGFDHFITDRGFVYGRYVDDFFILSNDKEQLLSLIPEIRSYLITLGLTLHPNKIHLQPIRHSITFIGSVLKGQRIYAGDRTVGHAVDLIRFYNHFPYKEEYIESFAQRYNSYMGYLIHRRTYKIRRKLWNSIDPSVRHMLGIRLPDYGAIRVHPKYTNLTKLLRTYGKNNCTERELERN